MSATFMKNLKKKTVGVACITALTLGTGTAGVVALNAAHAAEASASATTNQARTNTDKTVQVSDFTAKAPSQTIDNYVHWIYNDSNLPTYNTASSTTYTVNVADLAGVGIKPETLLIGAGATNSSADSLDQPVYAGDDASKPNATTLTLGSSSVSTTIRANSNGTITIPRNDDTTQRITFLYTAERADGNGTVTQRITFNPTLPTRQQGAVSANTTIGQLSTTAKNPSEVNVNDAGDVTFTYTNNSQVPATTAAGSSLDDGKIHLSMTRDGKPVTLEKIEIKPGETKTISVQNVKASSTAGEVTGSDFKIIEKVPSCSEPIYVGPSDHLAARTIVMPADSNMFPGTATEFFSNAIFGKDVVRAAPITPTGAKVETYDAKTSLSPYLNGQGTLDVLSSRSFGATSATAACYISSEHEHTYDYSVYVKPVDAPEPTPTPEPDPSETPEPEPTPTVEPTPEPTPSTSDVTPEPTPSETTPPAPKPSEPVVTPSSDPTPSESTPPAPTTNPSPSTPAVTPEPSAPVTSTPEPTPSETTPPAPTTNPSPSTPAVTPEPSAPVTSTPEPTPSETTPPAPTQEATTPAPSVSPSEPVVEKPSDPATVTPSEPAKPIQAKTGHEGSEQGSITALFAGIAAGIAVIGGILAGLIIRKKRKEDVVEDAPATEEESEVPGVETIDVESSESASDE